MDERGSTRYVSGVYPGEEEKRAVDVTFGDQPASRTQSEKVSDTVERGAPQHSIHVHAIGDVLAPPSSVEKYVLPYNRVLYTYDRKTNTHEPKKLIKKICEEGATNIYIFSGCHGRKDDQNWTIKETENARTIKLENFKGSKNFYKQIKSHSHQIANEFQNVKMKNYNMQDIDLTTFSEILNKYLDILLLPSAILIKILWYKNGNSKIRNMRKYGSTFQFSAWCIYMNFVKQWSVPTPLLRSKCTCYVQVNCVARITALKREQKTAKFSLLYRLLNLNECPLDGRVCKHFARMIEAILWYSEPGRQLCLTLSVSSGRRQFPSIFAY